MAQAIDALPDDTREVVTLFYRENCSVEHVARLLDLSEAAVKQRLSRARARLRADLAARFGKVLARTAPGSALAAAIAAAVKVAAPGVASAAQLSTAAKLGAVGVAGKKVVTAGLSIGILAAWRAFSTVSAGSTAGRATRTSGVACAASASPTCCSWPRSRRSRWRCHPLSSRS